MFAIVLIVLGFNKRESKKAFKNGYITCVYFHDPGRKLFKKCLNWLIKNGYTILSAKDLVSIYKKEIPIPAGAAWLSFDDGWKNNITDVLPVLKENKTPATFFISTEPVESSGVFWWSFAERHKDKLPEKFRTDFELLWSVPEKERKEVIESLRAKSKDPDVREAMTVDDIRSIAKHDYITIGSHTVNHVITVNCNDEELEYELSESKKKLEEWTGKKVNIFSYPNGDYGIREKTFLKRTGYDSAVIAENRLATLDDDIYDIPRFSIGNGFYPEELCHMTGLWQKIMKKLK